jgi:hypothetical protein
VFGVIEAGLAGTVAWAVRHCRPAVAALAGAGAAVVAGSAASYLYSTGPGKRAIWAQLLDELGLRGDEHVLDVGCGRGAVLRDAELATALSSRYRLRAAVTYPADLPDPTARHGIVSLSRSPVPGR